MKKSWRIVQAGLLGCFLLSMQYSSGYAETPVTAGIWCKRSKSYGVSAAHEEQLVNSLRRITGFQRLGFKLLHGSFQFAGLFFIWQKLNLQS